MKFNHLSKPFFILMLVLGLMAGCASGSGGGMSAGSSAEQAIADAKSALAEAQSMGVAWRDTGKMIKAAEAALSAGDEAKATELADEARRQSENAMAQARSEEARLAENGTLSAGGSSAAGAMAGSDSYQVIRGDNLWNISGKSEVYANPYQWPLIYKANRDKINDADLIFPGQVFAIDRNASGADVDAAVEHAKTRGAWSVGTVEASDEAYLAQ
jgi:nucleoid-associated protein YgaU